MSAAEPKQKRVFRCTPAAVVAGAVMIPLFVLGWRQIEKATSSPLLVVLWSFLAFFVPVLVSTVDLKEVARRRQETGSSFRPISEPGDIRAFYLPAWKRMFFLAIAAISSLLVLRTMGVEF